MYYVYVIQGKDKYMYIGITNNVSNRLNKHNKGLNFATKPYARYKLIAYFAVKNKTKAASLEKYLKTGSGKAFLNKRVL